MVDVKENIFPGRYPIKLSTCVIFHFENHLLTTYSYIFVVFIKVFFVQNLINKYSTKCPSPGPVKDSIALEWFWTRRSLAAAK